MFYFLHNSGAKVFFIYFCRLQFRKISLRTKKSLFLTLAPGTQPWRRVREHNVYCEIYPYNKIPEIDLSVKGVILSGSPFSVRDPQAPQVDLSNIKGKLPLLAICYGAQYLAQKFGGEVNRSFSREYGRAMLSIEDAQSIIRNSPTTNR